MSSGTLILLLLVVGMPLAMMLMHRGGHGGGCGMDHSGHGGGGNNYRGGHDHGGGRPGSGAATTLRATGPEVIDGEVVEARAPGRTPVQGQRGRGHC